MAGRGGWVVAALLGMILGTAACGGGTNSSSGGGGNGASAGTGTGAGGNGQGGNAQGGTGGDINLTTGSGAGSGVGGNGSGGGNDCNPTLKAMVRDFQSSHPDFEKFLGDDPGIITKDLGADGKPVYAGNPTTPTTTGKTNFDQWYRDVSGVNIPIEITIPLQKVDGQTYTYDNPAFFPIDGQGWGNEFNTHNYHFTVEVHTQFTYEGGEIFTFTGDDDLFTYINKKRVINLGGVHGAESSSVNLDQVAGDIGLVKGQKYPLDIFSAERHTSESHFRIDTTIGCFTPPPVPK
jgi:fibro-slime domain-containing protein